MQHNRTTTPSLVMFTYKTMAKILGAIASTMTVVEAAGKAWWKYYQVRILAGNLSHNQ